MSPDGFELGSLLPVSMSDDGAMSEEGSATFSEFGPPSGFLFPAPNGRGFVLPGRLF